VTELVVTELVTELLVAEVVVGTNTPMQTYWSVVTPSEPALPSPKASKPPFQTQLWAKAGKGPKVEPESSSALIAAPKHSSELATSARPAEAQLRPAGSRE
jgi:hypothetical protein